MKQKLSATVEKPLLKYLDSLPGKSRSAKLERILSKFKQVDEEKRLRRLLGEYREDQEEQAEREAWKRAFEEGMWTE